MKHVERETEPLHCAVILYTLCSTNNNGYHAEHA